MFNLSKEDGTILEIIKTGGVNVGAWRSIFSDICISYSDNTHCFDIYIN